MKRRLLPAAWILIAMAIGIALACLIFASFPEKTAAAASGSGCVFAMSDMYDVSQRLIKLPIGPLVFSALVVGFAHRGGDRPVWCLSSGALGWFGIAWPILALIVAKLLGDGLPNCFRGNEAPPSRPVPDWNPGLP
jgi:Na+/H+-dicarboxylate symporter